MTTEEKEKYLLEKWGEINISRDVERVNIDPKTRVAYYETVIRPGRTVRCGNCPEEKVEEGYFYNQKFEKTKVKAFYGDTAEDAVNRAYKEETANQEEKEMIKQYQENRKVIDSLSAHLEKKREEKAEAMRQISVKYCDLKYHLTKMEEKETKNIVAVYEKGEATIKQSIAEHSEIIAQVKRILAFKAIAKKPVDLSFEVKTYHSITIELIDTIKTSCLELRVYIYENGKPKNKYALVVIGKSIFGYNEKLGKFPRSYGLRLNDHGANICLAFKDSPTVESLKEYYDKNKAKLLRDFLTQQAELEKEYEAVQRDCNTPEWERLYWENEKEYYEKHYSRGTETEEYKAVLRELKKLNYPLRTEGL